MSALEAQKIKTVLLPTIPLYAVNPPSSIVVVDPVKVLVVVRVVAAVVVIVEVDADVIGVVVTVVIIMVVVLLALKLTGELDEFLAICETNYRYCKI